MALSDISLTAGMRGNLLSLQSTATLLDRTQNRLSTGKKVNTALDNPTNFFSAQANTQRASDLSTRKDGMSEAVQGVQAANQGITAISALIEAAKGLTQAAQSADTANRNSLAQQYNTVLTQITQLASDSGYKGKNFLNGDTLNVLFNENGGSALAISGFTGSATGLNIQSITIAAVSVNSGTGTVTASANVAIHNAALDTSSFTGVGTGTFFFAVPNAANSTTVDAAEVGTGTGGAGTGTGIGSGTTFVFSFATGVLPDPQAQGLVTGSITVNKVLANGVDVSAIFTGSYTGTSQGADSFTMTVTGLSGILAALQASGQTLTTMTGNVTISLDVTIKSHTSSGATVTQQLNVFSLASGDIGSGLSILNGVGYNGPSGSAVSGQSLSGIKVYVDGNFMAPTSGYHVSGNSIVFTGGILPPSSTVTYAYNSGYTATGAALVYGGSTSFTVTGFNSGTDVITGLKLGGTALDSGQYTVSTSGVITLAAGVLSGGTGNLTFNNTSTTAGGWDTAGGISGSVDALNTAVNTLRTQSANLASNLNVVTVRQDFTNGMIATLQKGADNLTLADMNEEGANMLMLQTRQQLGTTSLKMASDAAQSVLRLF